MFTYSHQKEFQKTNLTINFIKENQKYDQLRELEDKK